MFGRLIRVVAFALLVSALMPGVLHALPAGFAKSFIRYMMKMGSKGEIPIPTKPPKIEPALEAALRQLDIDFDTAKKPPIELRNAIITLFARSKHPSWNKIHMTLLERFQKDLTLLNLFLPRLLLRRMRTPKTLKYE